MVLIEQIPYRGLVAEIAGDIWRNSPRPIPADFRLGVATAAYQIEGATHYYVGQPELLARCISTIQDWTRAKGLSAS